MHTTMSREKRKERKDAHLNTKNNDIFCKEQSHMTCEIKRCCQPYSSLHVKLSSFIPELCNRIHNILKCLCIHPYTISNTPKVSQIKYMRPQPRYRTRYTKSKKNLIPSTIFLCKRYTEPKTTIHNKRNQIL